MDIGNKTGAFLFPNYSTTCTSYYVCCFAPCTTLPCFTEFAFKNTLQSVLSTKIHFKHPPCNDSTLLCLPLLFGLLLSVINSRSTHYFNVVNRFPFNVLIFTHILNHIDFDVGF